MPSIQRIILPFNIVSTRLKKKIAILGSTGSIGTQALDVIRSHADLFRVEVLTAHTNCDLLIKQAIEFSPNAVVIGNVECYSKVSAALKSYPVKVFAGQESIEQAVLRVEDPYPHDRAGDQGHDRGHEEQGAEPHDAPHLDIEQESCCQRPESAQWHEEDPIIDRIV